MAAHIVSRDRHQLLTPAAHIHCSQAISSPKIGLVLAGVRKPDPNGEVALVPGRYAAFAEDPNVAPESGLGVASVGNTSAVR